MKVAGPQSQKGEHGVLEVRWLPVRVLGVRLGKPASERAAEQLRRINTSDSPTVDAHGVQYLLTKDRLTTVPWIARLLSVALATPT